MKKYGIILFAVCVVAVQLSAGNLPEYVQRQRNLRQRQVDGSSDPVEHLRRVEDQEEQSMLWFVPSKETRKRMATGAKSKWQSFKKGLKKKKEGLRYFIQTER